MLNALNKSGLIEAGYKKIGQKKGQSIYKRIVPQFELNDHMAHFHNGTRARQVTEFAYLDDASDKVVRQATRRVGEYGDSAKSINRWTGTEFSKEIAEEWNAKQTFLHTTETTPVHYSGVGEKLPGTISVDERSFPLKHSDIGAKRNFVSFDTNGNIQHRIKEEISENVANPNAPLHKVWAYNTIHQPNTIQAYHTVHEIHPTHLATAAGGTNGYVYTPIINVGGNPKYTSLTDIKANNNLYTKEFIG